MNTSSAMSYEPKLPPRDPDPEPWTPPAPGPDTNEPGPDVGPLWDPDPAQPSQI